MHFKSLLLLCGLISFTAAVSPNKCMRDETRVCCNNGGNNCQTSGSGGSCALVYCCTTITRTSKGVDISSCRQLQ
ncbi:hypothetical protein K457DRAFT_143222 [Linnemannia elongata AG-77]|uniref:Uncharacterized protein n=1 Tax=Linnemannia elongata AG-77 TaxID=1314771 RepID=A0A197JCH9_9FUNG|nr:hypothetical protein K457DRAFT_143222 [Linnemannia elongata AG-77]